VLTPIIIKFKIGFSSKLPNKKIKKKKKKKKKKKNREREEVGLGRGK
jgi:hypothetical protein